MTPFQRGNQLFAQRRYREAISEFVRHAEEFPEESAKALTNAGKCQRRINTLAEPREVAPGVTQIHQGDQAGASEYFRAALEADPDHFAALRGLAEVLPERSPERREVLERAAVLRPDILVLLALGDYYRSVSKEAERAYGVYRRAQEAHPHDKTAYLRLNHICRKLGRHEEAKEWSSRWREIGRPGGGPDNTGAG